MGLELLDREEERRHLIGALPPRSATATVTLLQGPSGFGKTTLTDWLSAELREAGVPVIVADPRVRTSVGPHVVHQGFYLQRCAEAMDEAVSGWDTADTVSFQRYLEGQDLRDRFAGYDVRQHLRQSPGLGTAVGIANDVVDRLMAKGKFSHEALFKSDSTDAALVCAAYFREMVERAGCVLVIRETQHCDTMSLEELLRLNAESGRLSIVMEYTTTTRSMKVEHEKIFDMPASRTNLKILDLPPLPEAEFGIFLGHHGSERAKGDYARWDGNLRTIKFRRHRIELSSGISESSGVPLTANKAFEGAIAALSRAERFVLALLVEHVEPVSRDVLTSIVPRLPEQLALMGQLPAVIDALATAELIAAGKEEVSIDNDDVARAARKMPDHQTYAARAVRDLLNFYEDVLVAPTPSSVSFVQASRQSVRLASWSRDLPRLIDLLDRLDRRISETSDPAMYVGLVADHALQAPDLGQTERRRLSEWAASIAYRSGDFATAVSLLDQHGAKTPYALMLLANGCIQIDELDRVREMAAEIAMADQFPEGDMIAAALEANLDLIAGRADVCQNRLGDAITVAAARGSLLEGTLLRLLESALGARAAVVKCERSIAAFEHHGAVIAAAYSRIALVRHLARLGEAEEADRQLDMADAALGQTIAARQFLLNNRAGIELLKREPDHYRAFGLLREAGIVARDRFSEIVISHNMVIAARNSGRESLADETAGRLEELIRGHGPSERLLCIPIAHGLGVHHDERGRPEDASSARSIPRDVFMIDELTPYWAWRMGGPPPTPHHLAPVVLEKPYHPIFLSQWHLDEEIARTLTERSA